MSSAGNVIGIEQFHVARGDTPIGRFGVVDILTRVEKGELDPFDHVYDEGQQDWVSIIVHPVFAKHAEFWKKYQHKNVAKPGPESVANGGSKNASLTLDDGREAWFVLKGDHRFGPFDYLELVRLCQENNLQDWDYVWTKRMPKWMRLSSIPDFKPEAIQKLRESLSEKLGGSVNEVFFRRRFARALFEGSILVHNNQRLFKGRSLEMGAGGLSLVIQDGDLKIGDHVHVHIKPSRETPAFNSACEVMSRRVMNAGDAGSPVVFGLKFLALEENLKTQIDGWATKVANETTSTKKPTSFNSGRRGGSEAA